jgi:hypothetical protein
MLLDVTLLPDNPRYHHDETAPDPVAMPVLSVLLSYLRQPVCAPASVYPIDNTLQFF